MIAENMVRLNELGEMMRGAIFRNATGEISPKKPAKTCLMVKTESEKLRQESKEHELAWQMKPT